MSLRARVSTINALNETEVRAMLELMQRHYDNVRAEDFERDLRQKDHVFLLEEEDTIHGFSTIQAIEKSFEGQDVILLYSGDTIVEKSRWGSIALPLAVIRYILDFSSHHPYATPYWLLTTKGPRTYRFLPVYFREYYPCYQVGTPEFEKRLLESSVRELFPDRFNALKGLLRAGPHDQKLQSLLADVPPPCKRDPDVEYFLKRNPGFGKGDELVCLAKCTVENFKPFVLKRVQER